MNLYGYAGGDPINFADPFGLCPDSLSSEEIEECEKREQQEVERQKAEAEARAAAEVHARCMAARTTLYAAAGGDVSFALGVGAVSKATRLLSGASRYSNRSVRALNYARGIQESGATSATGVAVGVGTALVTADAWYNWVPGLDTMSRVVDLYIACSDKY